MQSRCLLASNESVPEAFEEHATAEIVRIGEQNMNRRLFASALVTASFALSARASAQDSTPDASPESTITTSSTLLSQPGFMRAVSRDFEVTEEGAAAVLEGGLVLLQTYGVEFDTAVHASSALGVLKDTLPGSLGATSAGASGSEITEASIGEPGDERVGLDVKITFPPGALFQELAAAIVLVRKDRFLQALTGANLMGAMTQVAEIATTLDERWPSDDLWDLVPTIDDLPVGMAVTSEDEILPES
jgi:hypothetical protein